MSSTTLPKFNRNVISALIALAIGLLAPSGALGSSYLGAAADYAVLGLYTSPANGTFINLSNVTIGSLTTPASVGVGPNGSLSFMAPSSVYGNIYVDPSASASGPGKFLPPGSGNGFVSKNLSQANADALSAYNDAISRTPTQSFGNITSNQTIAGNGGMNVIDISSINLGGSDNLLFSGSASDFFIVNVTGGLTLGGSSIVGAGPGVDASQVVLNFVGTGTTLTSHVDNMINGTVLAPYRSIVFHSANGIVVAGGSTLTLMSGAHVNYQPPVPEPSSLLALGTGLLGLTGLIRKTRTGRS